jgi:methylmalonyl-CoA mutase
MLSELQKGNSEAAKNGIMKVQDAAINNRNMFEELMETCKCASLGQITHALFEVGGQYRRNM